jgi:hypothetical protein
MAGRFDRVATAAGLNDAMALGGPIPKRPPSRSEIGCSRKAAAVEPATFSRPGQPFQGRSLTGLPAVGLGRCRRYLPPGMQAPGRDDAVATR